MAGDGTGGQLSGWDWAVFVVALMASLGTGIFVGWARRRNAKQGDDKSTAEEFLMGGRTMNPIAVALSTLIGSISTITVLGNSAEMYSYGTQLWMNLFGIVLGFVFVHFVNLAVFFPLKITSVYSYIKRRFQSKSLWVFVVIAGLANSFFFLGFFAYGPSLALNTVTGLPTWVSIVIMGVICTIYSSWGGVRAVVYTDVLQTFVLLAGLLVIVVTAVVEVGGLGNVWDIAQQHGRVELWNIDPDPLQRHSLWLVIIQGYFYAVVGYGMAQAQVQRICSVSTWRKAVGAHYLTLAILIMVVSLCNLMGIAVYAVYADCDPMATGEVQKADQIVPFYVIDRLGSLPGVPGLFMAALYASSMSSYSSHISGVTAILWEDFFKNLAWVANMREERRAYVSMVVSAVTGLAGVVAGILSMHVSGMFQACQTIIGTINSPQLGLFLLGMCCPFANKIGGIVGLSVSFAFTLWITVGARLYGTPAPTLRFYDDGCNATSSLQYLASTSSSFLSPSEFSLPSSLSSYSTSSSMFSSMLSSTFPPFSSTTEDTQDPYVFPLYLISYTLYSLFGVSIVVFVGSVTSLLTKPWSTRQSGKDLLHHTFYSLQRKWEKRHAHPEISISTQDLMPLEKY